LRDAIPLPIAMIVSGDRIRSAVMNHLPTRQLLMGVGCFGMFSLLSVTIGDWIVLTLAVWLFTAGKTPSQAWRALLGR
jgi:hypothetical protein